MSGFCESIRYHVDLLFIDMYAAVFADTSLISRVDVAPFVVPLLSDSSTCVFLHVLKYLITTFLSSLWFVITQPR